MHLKFTAMKPAELWCSSSDVETTMHMQTTSCHIMLHGQLVNIYAHFCVCVRAAQRATDVAIEARQVVV